MLQHLLQPVGPEVVELCDFSAEFHFALVILFNINYLGRVSGSDSVIQLSPLISK